MCTGRVETPKPDMCQIEELDPPINNLDVVLGLCMLAGVLAFAGGMLFLLYLLLDSFWKMLS